MGSPALVSNRRIARNIAAHQRGSEGAPSRPAPAIAIDLNGSAGARHRSGERRTGALNALSPPIGVATIEPFLPAYCSDRGPSVSTHVGRRSGDWHALCRKRVERQRIGSPASDAGTGSFVPEGRIRPPWPRPFSVAGERRVLRKSRKKASRSVCRERNRMALTFGIGLHRLMEGRR